MKKQTMKGELNADEITAVVGKIINVLNNNEKHIGEIPDLVRILGTVITSVVGSVAETSPSAARTIWLNVVIRVNDWLKKGIGSPIDFKIMDYEPLKD